MGKGSRQSDISGIGITLNGILIAMIWRYARMARLELHQGWMIHAFLLITGRSGYT